MSRRPRLSLRLPELDPGLETDSVRRTNATVYQLLARRYRVLEREPSEPLSPELIVEGALTREPARVGSITPPRLIFAHGALGDPGHWLMTLPFLRACDCLALSSSSDRAIFERLAGSVRCRTAWLPLCVDTSVFRPRPELRQMLRARYGIAQDAPLLLTVSALAPGKNVQSALLLLRELRRARPDAQCLVVGAGETTYLADLAARLGLPAAVRFMDPPAAVRFMGPQSRDELSELYAAADLLVHLTLNRKENLGLVSIEAQACGLPVLAGRWGGVGDTVAHGETGYLADAYLVGAERRVDWLSLAPHALQLMAEPALARRVGQAARARAVREYSVAAFARRLYRVIDRQLPLSADTRCLTLSAAAQELVVAFAARAAAHPEAEDSAALSETLREPFEGTFAYRAIHEQMALPAPPARTEAGAVAYRLLDAELEPASARLHVHDPLWAATMQLTAAEARVWSALGEPCERALLQAELGTEGAEALEQLYARGLVGLTPRPRAA